MGMLVDTYTLVAALSATNSSDSKTVDQALPKIYNNIFYNITRQYNAQYSSSITMSVALVGGNIIRLTASLSSGTVAESIHDPPYPPTLPGCVDGGVHVEFIDQTATATSTVVAYCLKNDYKDILQLTSPTLMMRDK